MKKDRQLPLHRRLWRDRTSWLMMGPYLFFYLLMILIPIAVSIGLSFTYFNMFSAPRSTGLENYVRMFMEDDVFITALGDVAARRRCVDALAARGARFIPLVHRSASLGPHVRIGAGSLVAQNAVVSADAVVGRHACIFQNTVVGHDARVGDFAHVYALCALGGGVTLGAGAVVYPGARIVPRRAVGAGAVVGIGAVVLVNVRAGETVFGNPAKPVEVE